MSKPLLGLILGGILGAIDGLAAFVRPELRNQMVGIVIGSTFKGLIAGVLIGLFARKVKSTAGIIVFALIVSGLLAFGIAAMQNNYYFQITSQGAIVGLIVGFAVVKYGKPSQPAVNARS